MINIFVNVNNETNLITINDLNKNISLSDKTKKQEEIDYNLFEKINTQFDINIENLDVIQQPTFIKYNNELINKCFTLLPIIIKECNLMIKDNTFKIMFETNQFIKVSDKYIKNPNYEYIWITFNKLVEHNNKKSYNVFISYNLILEDYNKTFISKSSEPYSTKYFRDCYKMNVKKIMITNAYNDFITIINDDYDIISHNLIKDICKNSITFA